MQALWELCDPSEKMTRVSSHGEQGAVLYEVGILDVIPDRLSSISRSSQCCHDDRNFIESSRARLLFFAVANRSSTRSITYDNKNCRRAEKTNEAAGATSPGSTSTARSTSRIPSRFSLLPNNAARVGKFARFISARAKIHVRDTRVNRDGRRERYRASARVYAALDGIGIRVE